jgi:hypothetical protein
MYSEGSAFIGDDKELSYNKVADWLQRDHKNLKHKLMRYRREGTPLSERLERDVFWAVCQLHDEIPLHTYPRRIMALMRNLRNFEVSARQSISGFDVQKFQQEVENSGAEEEKSDGREMKKLSAADILRSIFEANVSEIGDVFFRYIVDALSALDREIADKEDKLNFYCAASTLLTLVDLWDEAAAKMKTLMVESREDVLLDFECLGIEGLHTAIDLAEKAFDLYEEVESSLRKELRAAPEDRLLRQDQQIAASNMAASASYGFDWAAAEPAFLDIIYQCSQESDTPIRAKKLADRGSIPLKSFSGLFERHSDHAVLGRNLIYFGIQQRNKEIVRSAAVRLAPVLGRQVHEMLSAKIAGRKPLEEEPHLKIDAEIRSWFETEEAAR